MLVRLLAVFIAVPLTELYLLLQVGSRLGVGTTILLVVVTGVVGAHLARRESLRTLREIQRHLRHGILPTDELVDGALIVVAGLLLITPGLLTDAIGFGLLLPRTRAALRRHLRRRMTVASQASSATVEVEFTRRPD